ncbi:hypothetical protein EVAR_96530_1 [Eumeta japonica]|uniref:Uncharacterized protein n=1 Tax=Eumeta variegata TaxID=151549 RepID=A0A4C1WDT7_EUMVA|nr:hypothetical protein EVAR_96530_1 [Eumeta japonica]
MTSAISRRGVEFDARSEVVFAIGTRGRTPALRRRKKKKTFLDQQKKRKRAPLTRSTLFETNKQTKQKRANNKLRSPDASATFETANGKRTQGQSRKVLSDATATRVHSTAVADLNWTMSTCQRLDLLTIDSAPAQGELHSRADASTAVDPETVTYASNELSSR